MTAIQCIADIQAYKQLKPVNRTNYKGSICKGHTSDSLKQNDFIEFIVITS